MSTSTAPVRPTGRTTGPRAAPAVAGIVGPILFTATFVVQGLLRPDEYDPIAEPVSALAAGPNGWIQNVNFVVFGVLTIAFAAGLHRGVRPSRGGWAGPAILVLTGLGLFWAAAFPLREDASGVTLPPGLHVVSGVIFFLGSAVGLIVLSRRLARDPRWRGLAAYALVAGSAGVVGVVVMVTLVLPDGAPLHPWGGLAQRVLLVAVLLPCTTVLAVRLLGLARSAKR